MQRDPQILHLWAKKIRKIGMHEFAAAFLEAGAPLGVLGAQILYLGQPLLRSAMPDEHLLALAQMLEEPTSVRRFAAYLREENAA